MAFLRCKLMVFGLIGALASPINAQDAALSNAFEAGRAGEWDSAYGLVGLDLLAHDLITWTRLREGEGTFGDYIAFTAEHPDWPGIDRLRARGEESITDETDPSYVVAWFADNEPETGTGGLRLALALRALGQNEQARAVIQNIWEKYGLTEEETAAIIAEFGPDLTAHHAIRAENMLWRSRADDVEWILDYLPDDDRAVAEARIALIRRSSDWGAKLSAVPATRRDDVGLAYDRMNFLSNRGDYTDAIAILLTHTDSAESLYQPFRWSGWRRNLARWDMREGRYHRAYQLASMHFLTPEDGESYADLEWLSGYIALRFLDQPAVARIHFNRLKDAVDGPISSGRAGYWLGRTYDALGDAQSAQAAYAEAAAHQTAFYGLLAAEKLGQPLDPSLIRSELFDPYEASPVSSNEWARSGFELLDAGERGSAVLFFAALGRKLDRAELGSLGLELRRRNEPFFMLLLGKSAAARGMIIPDLYFPLHDLHRMDLPVDPELALSIARRESEFNPVVGSAVGALGLMQIMPATAEEVAGELDLPYSRARLTADWEYNATLGAKYLWNLQDRFGPSPVMIAAGYNAGPSRPARWIDERGDPRTGDADVIDWIEMIPFSETRNYVQRVTESILIYNARLNGTASGPIEFSDLLRGVKPLVRPAVRPWDETVEPSMSTSPYAPVTAPRPLARP